MTDFFFDESVVTPDLLIECRISDGPRRDDASFDPTPGDLVLLDDGQDLPIEGVVLRRIGDEVLVQIPEPDPAWVAVVRHVLFRDRHRPHGRRRRGRGRC